MVDYFNPAGRGGVNPLDAYQAARNVGLQEQELQREAQQRGIVDTLSKSQNPMFEPEFNELLSRNPSQAMQIMQASGARDEARLDAMLKDAKQAQYLLSTDQAPAALNLLSERANLVSQLGGDASDTNEIINDIRSGNVGDAQEKLSLFRSVFSPQQRTQDKTSSVRDFEYWENLKKTDPEAAKAFGRQAGFDRLTKTEEAELKAKTAGDVEGAKGNVKRLQGYIDSGIAAADSVNVLKRTQLLLDQVKTGGFDKVNLLAKQLFGIESADEAELTANLGKAVLSQLKPIFGSAFTDAEGKRLEKIEANLGKNTEGNKRLIRETLKITERAARRGLAAAKKQEDFFTAEEIQKLLDEEISLDAPTQQQAQPQSFAGFKLLSVE